MDALAQIVGYGVIIFGVFWLISRVINHNDKIGEQQRYVAGLYCELALRQLYWSTTDEATKEAIKAFAMGPGFTGWATIVLPDAEYFDLMQKLGHMNQYYEAKNRFESEGSPYKLVDHEVRLAKGGATIVLKMERIAAPVVRCGMSASRCQ